MRIHLHLPRLASCLSWPIAKSGMMVVETARCVLRLPLGGAIAESGSIQVVCFRGKLSESRSPRWQRQQLQWRRQIVRLR